jgi:hypothetical protein
MSQPKPPKPAKLVVGLFMNDKHLIYPLTDKLSESFGSVDMVSPWFPFDYTSYYEAEMGSPLFRKMMAFETYIEQTFLPDIKILTNDIEKRFTKDGKRSANIDPGYLVHERFVLATGKNYSHRIYLEKGIYADLTLIYQKGAFRPLPWTYPDYSEKNLLVFLQNARNKYVADFKKLTDSEAEHRNQSVLPP